MSFEYVTKNGVETLTKYISNAQDIVILCDIQDVPVVALEDRCFAECDNLQTLTIKPNRTPECFMNMFVPFREVYSVVEERMASKRNNSGIVIVVSAPQPLGEGELPNGAYGKRLQMAADMYKESNEPAWIYVSGAYGSPISRAGKQYLINKGVSEKRIITKDTDTEYVVSCNMFRDLHARELHCICEEDQVIEKIFDYVSFECIPFIHTSTGEVIHSHDFQTIFDRYNIKFETINILDRRRFYD